MNFGRLSETLQNIGQSGSDSWLDMQLSAGRAGLWSALQNLRLQIDGDYAFWKPRGGSELLVNFFGQIRTVHAFSTTVNGTQGDYVVVHTATGAAHLLKEGDLSANEIFPATTFTTSNEQITVINNGIFIYLLDFTENVFKVYNIERDTSHDWLSALSGLIHTATWVEDFDWTKENIWGFEEGRSIIAFDRSSYSDPGTQRRTYRSYTTRIDKVLSDRLVYEDPSGVTHESTIEEAFGIVHESPDLEPYINMASSLRFSGERARAVIEIIEPPSGNTEIYATIGGVKAPAVGSLSAANSDTKEDIAESIELSLLANEEITAVWDVSRLNGIVYLDHKSTGTDFEGIEASLKTSSGDASWFSTQNSRVISEEQVNADFEIPVVYRGYLIVDLLEDGSYAIPGKPITVSTTIMEAMDLRRGAVNIEATEVASNVQKRLLFATRWQTTEDKAYIPSRPEYENSAFYFAKEIDLASSSTLDATPDYKLQSPISAYIPIVAGVVQQFGANQITPISASSLQGTLLIGGYSVNRPTPSPYADAEVYGNSKNTHVRIGAGTDLTELPNLSFIFEYTDGRRSEVNDTDYVLTDAEEIIEDGSEGAKAVTNHWIPDNAPSVDGMVTVNYPDGIAEQEFVQIPYLGTDTLEEMIVKVVDGINADSVIQVTAAPYELQTEIRFTEKRIGSDYNGNIVRIDYPADGIQKTVTMSGGENGSPGLSTSGNWLQIHSLNALVTKVIVLAQIGGSATGVYRLLREVDINEGYFHGRRLFLPNSDAEITDLEAYVPSNANQVRESVDLHNWVVSAIPFQQPLISEQSRIEGDAPIQRIIGTQFDQDKTQLRYRVAVFTDRNLQIGYITLSEGSTDKRFEVIGQGVTLRRKYSAHYLRGEIIFQTDNGIFTYSQNGWNKIIDNDAFSMTANALKDVTFNRNHNEIWLTFQAINGASSNDYKVLVCNPDGSGVKEFIYPSSLGNVQGVDYIGTGLVLGMGTGLYYTDMDSLVEDAENAISCVATSRHIGSEESKTSMKELLIYGQNCSVQVDVDLQTHRKETSNTPPGSWQKDFTSDVVFTSRPAFMHGSNYQINKQAPMPRLRLQFDSEVGSFINKVKLKSSPTANAGKARS